MKLSVTPTQIEIVDEEMKTLVATVTMVDGVCVKVELPSGWICRTLCVKLCT
jgi:hypothetical protein